MAVRSTLSLSLTAIVVAVPVGLPVLVVCLSLLNPSMNSMAHLASTVLPDYLINTVMLMVLVGIMAAVIGVGTAWLTATADFPGSRWLAPALVLPLACPGYVLGYVYADLLEFSGPVQSELRALTGWAYGDYFFPPIRSLPGAAVVLAIGLFPYVYLLARTAFRQQSVSLFDAAGVLGAGRVGIFTRVALPAARPAIAGGLALVLMETVADYGVVQHYGVPTFTTGIFRTWLAMGDKPAALNLAAALFGIVLLLVLLEQTARRGRQTNPLGGHGGRTRRLGGVGAVLATLVCALPVVVGFVIPMSRLAWLSLTVGDPLPAAAFMGFVGNTVQVAALVAALCAASALGLVYLERLGQSWPIRLGVRAATLGYALPGTVLGIGMLVPLAAFDRWLATTAEGVGWQTGLLFTGTTGALALALIARFMTVAFNSTAGGMAQIHPQLDAAARSLGASPLGTLRRVHVPLLRPAVVGGMLLVFIDVMKELPATLILRPFNFETLATRVFRLASDERLAEASTAAIAIVLVGLIPTVMLMRYGDKRPT
jgi:iron(III) transport system permease protein